MCRRGTCVFSYTPARTRRQYVSVFLSHTSIMCLIFFAFLCSVYILGRFLIVYWTLAFSPCVEIVLFSHRERARARWAYPTPVIQPASYEPLLAHFIIEISRDSRNLLEYRLYEIRHSEVHDLLLKKLLIS